MVVDGPSTTIATAAPDKAPDRSPPPPDAAGERLGCRLRQRVALPEGLRVPDQAQARRRAGAVPAERPLGWLPPRAGRVINPGAGRAGTRGVFRPRPDSYGAPVVPADRNRRAAVR